MPTKLPSKGESKISIFQDIPQIKISELAHKLKDCCTDNNSHADEARFAIFLGAGASATAGIKTAGEMIEDFRERILRRKCPEVRDDKARSKWLAENVLDGKKGTEYSKLFEAFERSRRGRQRYISSLLKNKKPTFGYAMLANLVARGFVNTILTTNFDDLAFIGCTKFSEVRPVIYAYGLMATEMKFSSPHPKILKMHGDYLYSLLAITEAEMSQFNQDPNMKAKVRSAMEEFELIVFGYSGNDNSVLTILEQYPADQEMYWCYRKGEIPNERVLRLLRAKQGSLVEIEGFDDAMWEISQVVEFDLDKVVGSCEEKRKEILAYIDEFNKKYPTKIVEKVKEEIEKESARMEVWDTIFGEAPEKDKEFIMPYLKHVFSSPTRTTIQALFARMFSENSVLKTSVEKYLQRFVDSSPDNAGANALYGTYLLFNDPLNVKAEKYLKKAIKLKPHEGQNYYNLATWYENQERLEEALAMTQKAYKNGWHVLDVFLQSAALHKKLGNPIEAKRFAEIARKKVNDTDYYDLVCIYSLLNDKDKALDNLEKAILAEPYRRVWAQTDPDLEWIRKDPKFKKITENPTKR